MPPIPRKMGPMGEMPFLDHLEELRWRIFYSLIALTITTILGFLIVHYLGVLEILIRPAAFLIGEDGLAYFNPATPFFITLKLALVVGILLALPIVVYQVWAFLSPALKSDERRIIIPALYFGVVLFCAGVAMAYFLVLPLALAFLSGFQQAFLAPVLEVGEYLGFVTKLLIAFGIVFELPVAIMILSALGLVTPAFLRDKRRHAIVGIGAIAVMLTPGDLASTILMMAPMTVLYEVSILLSVGIHARRRAREEEERLRPSDEPPAGTVEVGG
jgi:sec-independent protein translocase protein TatC